MTIPWLMRVLRSNKFEGDINGLTCHAGILGVNLQIHHEALENLLHLHICLHHPEHLVHSRTKTQCCVGSTEELSCWLIQVVHLTQQLSKAFIMAYTICHVGIHQAVNLPHWHSPDGS